MWRPYVIGSNPIESLNITSRCCHWRLSRHPSRDSMEEEGNLAGFSLENKFNNDKNISPRDSFVGSTLSTET
jgi:hypothetical protein